MVTGASRGIGKATALALAEAGYDLVLAARTVSASRRASENVRGADGEVLPGTLEQTEAEVRAHGSDAISVPLDLLDLPSIDAALAEAKNYFGQIDVIVNNAIYQGPGLMADFLDGPFEDLEKTFKANVLAQAYIVRSLLPDMLARKSGTVVNLTSAAGMTSPPIKLSQGGGVLPTAPPRRPCIAWWVYWPWSMAIRAFSPTIWNRVWWPANRWWR